MNFIFLAPYKIPSQFPISSFHKSRNQIIFIPQFPRTIEDMDKGKGKSSKGRKKAAMKKIESENARNVRFSKRKAIVFAKASELSTMCGAEVAVLLRSPTGTLYTFGSPSADKFFSQFMTGESSQYCAPDPNLFNLLNQQCIEMSERLEAAKAKRVALNERMKKAVSEAKECEWIGKVDQLGGDELMQLLESLYRARVSLIARMNALSVEGSSVNEMRHALSVEGGVVSGNTVPSDVDVCTNMPYDAGTASGGVAPGVAPHELLKSNL